MIASLPMYDWPETMEYNDLFWNNLRTSLAQVCTQIPEQLTRTDLYDPWQRDDLLLSQTCIYPLATKLPANTVVLGTPLYDVEHCKEGLYASVLLVKSADHRNTLPDFHQSTLAFNSQDSQSGFNAFKSFLVEQQLIRNDNAVFFSNHVQTGSHRKSIGAVASGAADICAVDPVSWALAQRFDDEANQLRVLMPTNYTPALPLICAKAAIPSTMTEAQWRETLMTAFDEAIDQTASDHLLLKGITYLPKSQYAQLLISNLDMITD